MAGEGAPRSRYAANRGGRHPSPRRGGSVHTRTVEENLNLYMIDRLLGSTELNANRIRTPLQNLMASGMSRHTLITDMANRGHRPEALRRLEGFWDQLERDNKYWESRR